MSLRSSIIFLSAALLLLATAANAQQGRLEVITSAEKEQRVTDAEGNRNTRLVPVDVAVPGDEIIIR